jgi:hypothetical protein
MVYNDKQNATIIYGGCGSGWFNDMWALGLGDYYSTGSLTSLPQNMGGPANFGAIDWEAQTPGDARISFQLRGADTKENLSLKEFTGPDGTASWYYTKPGERAHSSLNGSTWIQYKAYFQSLDDINTPVLTWFQLDYNLRHTITLWSPRGNENWTGIHPIRWQASNPDNDSLNFNIYLEDENGSTSVAKDVPSWYRSWSWDTTDIPNGTYRLRIEANDLNPSIPTSVADTSSEFRILHYPPNRPPTVEMLEPADLDTISSSAARFSWKGSDMDNDPVKYNFYLSTDELFRYALGEPTITTTADFFVAKDLKNTVRYYWAVVPEDPYSLGLSPEVRLVTVQFTSGNHPPFVTSVPPASVLVGEKFTWKPKVFDPDGDKPVVSVTVDSTPLSYASDTVTWTPSGGDIGNHTLRILVTDGHGGSDELSFILHVQSIRPVCNITSPSTGAPLSGIARFEGTVIKGTSPVDSVQVRIDSGEWRNATGTEDWQYRLDTGKLKNGNHTFYARAFDGFEYSDVKTVNITVRNSSTKPTPFPGVIAMLLIISLLLGARSAWPSRNRSKEDL